MSIFININNKENKKLIYSLKKIYGIGLLLSKKICLSLGYDINSKILININNYSTMTK